jgi:D-3-phosphoglycerate dehydrogenase
MEIKTRLKIVSTVKRSKELGLSQIFSGVGDLESLPEVRELVLKKLLDADAYLASASILIDREFLDCAPNLKLIGSPSTGTDHMDIPLIQSRGIRVLDISKERNLLNQFTATSELAFCMLLNLYRNIPAAAQSALTGKWEREKFSGLQLFGKTLGLIGLGRLGSIAARIGSGFGMNVIGFDPYLDCHSTANLVSFEDVIKTSDVISLHVHLNESTQKLIGLEQFKSMKRNCVLINTSRGKIIDEDALLSALQNKLIMAAGLDVIDGEWLSDNARRSHPLIEYANRNQNLLILPHIGGSTSESIDRARIFMAQKMTEILSREQY